MKQSSLFHKEPWRPPHLGQRIVKTTVAVFVCLIIYYLRGYSGSSMPTESAITAIICMQPYVKGSRDYALNRFAGTFIGTLWGLLFLTLLLIPGLAHRMVLVYGLMSLGVLCTLYSAVLLGKADSSVQAAIVFLCIVITFPEIETPFLYIGRRILDVFIGTLVAIGVNVFRLPRRKQRDLVFFVRTKDLAPDRFSQIPSVALFRLNYLYNDGARICLMSEHAPAFFMLQMNRAKVNVPLIVMDGAAIYDLEQNRYLEVQHIAEEDSRALRRRLEELGLGCFVYTIHNNKTCIFHQGKLTVSEKLILDTMKRSPYRNYLEGENYDLNEMVYFKIIGDQEKLTQVEYQLRKTLPKNKLRAVARAQAGVPGVYGLYIYAHTATMEQAQKRLMNLLHQLEPQLIAEPVLLPGGYRTENDAIQVLNTLLRRYEPVALLPRRRERRPTP